jgi:GST-like protein
MLDVYSWATPNGHKVHIMLEECGLRLGRDWLAHPINIGQGDQFKPEFLKISPNNKIPALVDPQGPDGKPISLFESGAILLYLASKTGKFLPKSDRAKFEVLQLLMFQMGGCWDRPITFASMHPRRSTMPTTATPMRQSAYMA